MVCPEGRPNTTNFHGEDSIKIVPHQTLTDGEPSGLTRCLCLCLLHNKEFRDRGRACYGREIGHKESECLPQGPWTRQCVAPPVIQRRCSVQQFRGMDENDIIRKGDREKRGQPLSVEEDFWEVVRWGCS